MDHVGAGPAEPPRIAPGVARPDLAARYRSALGSRDPLERAIARHQLERLDRATGEDRSDEREDSGLPRSVLRDLVERTVGPLHERPNGDLQGPCPLHASSSGRCLVLFAGGNRWWCRSCRRGGDAVSWLMLVDGITRAEARRRLGLPADRRAVRRPILSVELVP
jgi:hypothetical protein